MSSRRTVFSHLRAVVIFGVCFIAIWGSLPMPGPGSKKALADPIAQEELQTWVELLDGVGWKTDKESLGDIVLGFGKGMRTVKGAIIDPIKPFFRITATWQGWGLFAYPDTFPHTLVVEGQAADRTWDTLHHARDDRSGWRAGLLHYRRVRALYNPGRKAPRTYRPMVTWLASRIFEDHPEFQRVRVRFTRQHTTLPGEERPDEKPKTRFSQVRDPSTPWPPSLAKEDAP